MDRASKFFMTLTFLTIVGTAIYKETTSPRPLFTDRDEALSKYSLEEPQPPTSSLDQSEEDVAPPSSEGKSQAVLKNGLYTINWELLYSYDLKTKKQPPLLKRIDGKMVKIPGYIVPLSDDYTKLDEFLLVPDPQSCVHVPPPPPNLIIWVKLEKSILVDDVPYPAWVSGIFSIEMTKSPYGNAAYKMLGKKLEPYED